MKVFHPLLTKSPWLTILIAVVAITAALNPRIDGGDGKLLVMSCNTKHVCLTSNYLDDYAVPTGVYSTKTLTKMVYQITADRLKADLAGNPFGYLAESMMENYKDEIINTLNSEIDDRCKINL